MSDLSEVDPGTGSVRACTRSGISMRGERPGVSVVFPFVDTQFLTETVHFSYFSFLSDTMALTTLTLKV